MQGPLHPRAFDLTAVDLRRGPVDAPALLHNSAAHISCFGVRGAMPQLARNSDGDWLLSFPITEKEVEDEAVLKVARAGARKGVEFALHSLDRAIEQYRGCLDSSAQSE